MRWYQVNISGRANGKPRDVKMTVRAEYALWAAYYAVGYEWPGMDLEHDYVRGPDGRRVVRFEMNAPDFSESRVFVTEHQTFDEMAMEVTGAAELAALEGNPVLPLELE